MDTDLSTADASFWGEDTKDHSGSSVSSAGDVNGDGYDDLLIGAYYDEDGGSGAGQTYLILGKSSGWAMDTDLSTADASFWGEDGGDRSGISVSSAGDVNGDGYDDLLIGAYRDDDGGIDAGQTYLVLGGKAQEINLKGNGLSIRDGSLHAQPNNHTYFGRVSATSGTIDKTFTIENTGFVDLTLNGTPKVLITGAHASDFTVTVDPVSPVTASGSTTFTIQFDPSGDGYRRATVSIANDDSDENPYDFVIKGRGIGSTPQIWAMDTDLSTSDASFWGEDTDDNSGYSVSSAGDVNGDGYDDLLIGAYQDDDGGSAAGQTYLILGKASSWAMDTDLSTADASFWGEDGGDQSGISVSSAGDVNGDGYDDLLIGAIEDDDGGSAAGQTYLILGKASSWAMDT
ncbi:MAG: choice-of-anchor D domain-containing protein, partial [Deltaproteobacteria bacterium]|nr:choice-of-anchor D domain-containing protein [Deltaproteobacteria bacterium]